MERKIMFFIVVLIIVLLLVADVTTPFRELAEAQRLQAEAAKLQAQAQLTQTRALVFLAVSGFTVITALLIATLTFVWRLTARLEHIEQTTLQATKYAASLTATISPGPAASNGDHRQSPIHEPLPNDY